MFENGWSMRASDLANLAMAHGARTLAFAGVFCAGLGVAVAQPQSVPDTDNGRYTMAPSGDGFIRLDTRTGEVSTCRGKGGWTCRIVPDERAALDAEIGRLQRENEGLKDQLARREDIVTGKIDAPLAKQDQQKPDASLKPPDKSATLKLPAEHDRLMAMLERAWQHLVDMAVRVQKRLSEKI